jgi:hypothetical protein
VRVQWAESLFDNTVLDAIDDYFPYEWMTLLHKCADNHKNTPAWQHICSLSAAEAEEELMKELEPLNALDKVLSMMKKKRTRDGEELYDKIRRREVPEEAKVAPDEDGNPVCMEKNGKLVSSSGRNVFQKDWQWTVCLHTDATL